MVHVLSYHPSTLIQTVLTPGMNSQLRGPDLLPPLAVVQLLDLRVSGHNVR